MSIALIRNPKYLLNKFNIGFNLVVEGIFFLLSAVQALGDISCHPSFRFFSQSIPIHNIHLHENNRMRPLFTTTRPSFMVNSLCNYTRDKDVVLGRK